MRKATIHTALAVLIVAACASSCSQRAHSIYVDPYEPSVTDTISAAPAQARIAIEKALQASGYTTHDQTFMLGLDVVGVRTADGPMYAGVAAFDPMGKTRKRPLPVRQDVKTGFGVDPPRTLVLVSVYPIAIAPHSIEIKVRTKAWHYSPATGDMKPVEAPDTAARLLLQEIRAHLR